MPLSAVSISLASYGHEYVRQRGQDRFAGLLHQAGATHIEWHDELFNDFNDFDGDALKRDAAERGLIGVYSSSLELWQGGERQPNPRLVDALERARACGAQWLKVTLGYHSVHSDMDALAQLLDKQGIRLLVENDQTRQGGRIDPLVAFFEQAGRHHLGVGMTFNIGNWQWQKQSVFCAALQLGEHVQYVHCKAVQWRAGKLVAVPPTHLDLQLWSQLLRRFGSGAVRTIDYPLHGEDLVALTASHVATLATLCDEPLSILA